MKVKQRLKYFINLIALYGFWIVLLAVQKPIFMLFNFHKGLSIKDYFDVVSHGFILDSVTAAYLTIIPLIIITVSYFVKFNLKRFIFIYTIIISIVVSILFAIDCLLFSYWGFRIDATIIFYLNNPSDSMASITFKDVIKFICIFIPYCLMIIFSYKYTVNKLITNTTSDNKFMDSLLTIIYLPLLFILVRGGVSTATANVGMVYFSNNQYLNQSSINPVFSLLYSLSKKEDFSKEYVFFNDKQQCQKMFNTLVEEQKDSTISVLNTDRPNVVIIILESFSANAVECVGGEKNITPNLNELSKEGIIFTNAYSNGMRTDRGVVSILTGFLAQPNMSIIKYPEKTRSLPTIAKSLSSIGYKTSMLYGGDINFANMKSYFYSSMYEKVIADKNFPVKYRLNKWGVNDETTFNYLYKEIKNRDNTKHYFNTFLTLSSHEPFEVPYHRLTDAYLNTVSYTDSCIGDFVKKLKQTPQWKNLLLIFVADHGYQYPSNIQEFEQKKYHIPMLWLGGAIKKHIVVKDYCNQTDIPKTLLKQMKLPCKDFIYSKNIFNDYAPKYAFYAYTNGFGFIDNSGITIYDHNRKQVIFSPNKERERKGKVLLQTLYQDISKR